MPNNTSTCIICESTYSLRQKDEVYSKLGRELIHPLTIYKNTCLDCSIDKLNNEADKSLLLLNKAVIKFRIFAQLYKKFKEAKQKLESRYSSLDQQYNYIKFFLREEAHARANKPPVMRNAQSTRNNASAKKQAAVIAELLASMSPEQQALIVKQARNI